LDIPDEVVIAGSLDAALQVLGSKEFAETLEDTFIIGGGSIYKEAVEKPECEKIFLTTIHQDYECDVFFPNIYKQGFSKPADPVESHETKGVQFDMNVLTRSGMGQASPAAPITSAAPVTVTADVVCAMHSCTYSCMHAQSHTHARAHAHDTVTLTYTYMHTLSHGKSHSLTRLREFSSCKGSPTHPRAFNSRRGTRSASTWS
jgi:hypothetical protein